MTKKKKKTIDWKGIERDFRAGKTSIRQIAEWYGVSEGAIRKRAKRDNWSQLKRPSDDDLGAFRKLSFVPPVQPGPEAHAVAADGRSLAVRMLDELRATTSLQGELEELIISETSDDRDGKRRTAMLRAVDLPNRARILKDLMAAAKTAAEVHKLEQKGAPGDDVSQVPGVAKPGDDWDQLLN